MKIRLILSLVLLLSVAAAPLLSRPAYSEAKSSVAVIDMIVIMRDSKAAKGMRKQMERELAAFRKWGKAEEGKFRAEGASLRKQETVLAKGVLRKRQLALQKKITDFQVQVRRREQKIRQAGAGAQQQLEKVLIAVVAEVAKQQGVGMVFPKSTMIYSGKTRDLTKQTLQKLNSKLPSIKIKVAK